MHSNIAEPDHFLQAHRQASQSSRRHAIRAANKTPWRCCVTLPYCLYCLRSHA
jgi:hypothetical protein